MQFNPLNFDRKELLEILREYANRKETKATYRSLALKHNISRTTVMNIIHQASTKNGLEELLA